MRLCHRAHIKIPRTLCGGFAVFCCLAGMALVVEALFLEEFDHGLADVGDGVRDGDACRVERRDFVRRRALAAGDDGAGVAHALARRRLTPCDEGGDGLVRHVLLDPLRRVLFGRAADLTDDEDSVGVGVILKELERVDEVRALDGVAADADGGRLADACVRELEGRLVGEGAGARDEADVAGLADGEGRAWCGRSEVCLRRKERGHDGRCHGEHGHHRYGKCRRSRGGGLRRHGECRG